MGTNVPQIQWTPTGLEVPSEDAILAGVQADFNAAFGGNLNLALNTPQGQLMTSMAAAIANAYALYTALVNGVDPALNGGFMQDAIAQVYFLSRNPGTPTVVTCTCTGEAGTPIPAGSPTQPQAQDTSGNLYYCVSGGTIPIGGSVALQFANVLDGPIACPATTLTTIYQAVPGWESITNAAPGIEGSNVETDEALEFRREQSVASNAQGSLPSIYGAVFGVPGVIDVFCTENDTNATVNYGSTNFPLLPNSIYVGVVGGVAAEVAQAIWTKKSPGCNMCGSTSVTVTDTSGYSYPYPTYQIYFNIPTPLPCYFSVTIKNVASLPANLTALVQGAIVNQFTGVSGPGRARIGSLLLASEYYAAVAAAAGPSVVVPIISVLIGTAFTGQGTLVNASSTLTVTTASTGQLTFGSVVTGTNIPANTYIVRQLTGTTGGVGTYQMSNAATGTVGSPEAITGAPGTSGQIGIDQAPTIAAANVSVALV